MTSRLFIKRIFSAVTFALVIMMAITALPVIAFAEENYEFARSVELTDNDFIYNGTTEVVIAEYIEPVRTRDYSEYDRYTIYDQGITANWVYLSNPYFIKSIARGMTYEKTTSVQATISASFGAGIPSEALPKIKSTFGLNSSGSKTITEKVALSGPDAGYSSRDFYYRQGRNRHQVKIVKERIGGQGMGVISTSTSYSTVDKPAIKTESVDRK